MKTVILGLGLAWFIIPYDIGYVSDTFSYNSWRIYLAICTIPAFTSALSLLFMPESPKFLMDVSTHHRNRPIYIYSDYT